MRFSRNAFFECLHSPKKKITSLESATDPKFWLELQLRQKRVMNDLLFWIMVSYVSNESWIINEIAEN